MRAGRDEREAGDHAGDLVGEGGLVDAVGPLHVAGLDGQMQLVADIRSGRAAVGGGAVPGPGVPVDGVLVAAVGTDAEHLGFAGRLLRLGHRPVVHELGLGCLAVEVDGDRRRRAERPRFRRRCRRPRPCGTVRNSSGTAAWARALANHLGSIPTWPASRTWASLVKVRSTRS